MIPHENRKVNIDECLVRFCLLGEGLCGYANERSRSEDWHHRPQWHRNE